MGSQAHRLASTARGAGNQAGDGDAARSELAAHLFAYGSLEVASVLRTVTGRDFVGQPARLQGYRRRLLEGEVYPAIIRDPAESTTGTLYQQLDATSIGILDLFEGEPYQRMRVAVEVGSGALHEAFAYVLKPGGELRLSARHWDLDHFLAHHHEGFIQTCRRFRAEVLRSGGDWTRP